MDKKGISQVVVMFVIMAVVALVLIYSLRVIPEEGLRQQTCQAHLGFCYEEGTTCPLGTNRIDYDCANEKPCCIGVVRGSTPTSPSTPGTPPAAGTAPSAEPDAAEERRRVEEIQERLTAARQEGNLEQISAGYDAAKALIIARFEQYRPPTSSPMTRENTPFNYNTVKSFEQLTLAAEAAFHVSSDEKKQWAGENEYFEGLCLDWAFLIRAHLEGFYDSSTYGLDNWLPNKVRVFRNYGTYISEESDACTAVIHIMREEDLQACRSLWLVEGFKDAALAQDTPTRETWGSCLPFSTILKSQTINFQSESFDITQLFYRQLQDIFQEESS